jgi:hypothetical protein
MLRTLSNLQGGRMKPGLTFENTLSLGWLLKNSTNFLKFLQKKVTVIFLRKNDGLLHKFQSKLKLIKNNYDWSQCNLL